MVRKVLIGISVVLILTLVYIGATLRERPERIEYGATFSAMYAEELGLNWRDVYIAVLDELEVRKLRIPAYWQRIENSRDRYDWSELDYQLALARDSEASVILALGRRVPRWPECHIPGWARDITWEEQKEELREYITAIVKRYKDNPAIEYWQVENEPYLSLFAQDQCGELDEAFLEEEIAIVRSLDDRPILLTDSGNLGLWLSPYKRGDAFGTSLYIYFWNPEVGQFKSRVPAVLYRVKERIAEIIYGRRETMLIELSLEPWLVEPLVQSSVDTQLSRMSIEKAEEILEYASRTSFEKQYLWGIEWWYYLKREGRPEFWDKAKSLYRQ